MKNWSDGYSYEYYTHTLDVLDYYRRKSGYDCECEDEYENSYSVMFSPKNNDEDYFSEETFCEDGMFSHNVFDM